MDSFEALIGKNINEVVLNESTTFFTAAVEYSYKNCGMRYPASKLRLADIDYFDFIDFTDLFKYESVLIVWYCKDIITDLELYYLSNDFDVLFEDYWHIRKAIDNGEAHKLREGDTRYLGAARLSEKVAQPNSDVLANKRELVLKKKYLQKIIREIDAKCLY